MAAAFQSFCCWARRAAATSSTVWKTWVLVSGVVSVQPMSREKGRRMTSSVLNILGFSIGRGWSVGDGEKGGRKADRNVRPTRKLGQRMSGR